MNGLPSSHLVSKTDCVSFQHAVLRNRDRAEQLLLCSCLFRKLGANSALGSCCPTLMRGLTLHVFYLTAPKANSRGQRDIRAMRGWDVPARASSATGTEGLSLGAGGTEGDRGTQRDNPRGSRAVHGTAAGSSSLPLGTAAQSSQLCSQLPFPPCPHGRDTGAGLTPH